MRNGKRAGGNARIAPIAWAVLISLAWIACGPATSEPLPAKKPKTQAAGEQEAVNPAKMTLKEYAALDDETRMAIAQHFAEKNAEGMAVIAAKEQQKSEGVPEGAIYMATEFDLSLLPNDADIDSHLLSLAAEQPDIKVATAAAAFCTEKSIEATKVEARVK